MSNSNELSVQYVSNVNMKDKSQVEVSVLKKYIPEETENYDVSVAENLLQVYVSDTVNIISE